MRRPIVWPLVAALIGGCAAGDGQGIVVGSLYVPGCDEDEAFDRRDSFDLGVDFFVAQPILDPDEDESMAQDGLSIRLQHGGSSTDVADGLSIQVVDVDEVNLGSVAPVEPGGMVRATLSMALRCPDAFEAMDAAAAEGATCPTAVGAGLFSGDFDDPDDFDDPFWTEGLQHPSCIVFDRIGTRFGDEIAAAFHFNLRDTRAREGEETVSGFVHGRFRFTLERGTGAQTFP